MTLGKFLISQFHHWKLLGFVSPGCYENKIISYMLHSKQCKGALNEKAAENRITQSAFITLST